MWPGTPGWSWEPNEAAGSVQLRGACCYGVQREWSPEDLVGSWTLVEEDWRLISNKAGITRLGFTVLLKSFEFDGRFPQGPGDVPVEAVAYVAKQVGVAVSDFADLVLPATLDDHR